MATPLLGLALPDQGSNTGVWGTLVNNSITSLLDSAVAGTTTLSTDTDVTLTTTTESANQAREAILLWTASGTVTRNITAPAQSKTYIVINSSGTQSIVLRGVGPTTGITVVAGEKCVAAWNGSDFVKVSSSTASGSVTAVTATAPVASSGGTTPVISIPAATASVNGYLTSTNWTTFNNKQNTISLTTVGTSGAASFDGTTLNIPNYATGGGSAATPTSLGTVYANTGSATPYVVALGYQAGTSNTGTYNVALGYRALTAAGAAGTTGSYNIGVGDESLGYVTSGSRNIGIGHTAVYVNGTGNDNIGIGYLSLASVLNRSSNVGIGTNALTTLQSGDGNVAVGYGAAATVRTVSNTTAVGYQALNLVTGNYNTAVGYSALSIAAAAGQNTAVGYNAGSSFTASSAGGNPGNHTLVGYLSGSAITTGYNNTFIGSAAGYAVTTQNASTALGSAAMLNTAATNSTCIGANTDVTGNNQVQLGDASTTTYVYGTVQNRSDIRDKADIRDTQLGLGFINALRPVDYRWDMREDYKPAPPNDLDDKAAMDAWRETAKLSNLTHDGSKKRSRYHHGLIAQEVKAVLDAQNIDFGGYQDHSVKGGDAVLSIGYDELIAPLIKAVQELTARVQELEAK